MKQRLRRVFTLPLIFIFSYYNVIAQADSDNDGIPDTIESGTCTTFGIVESETASIFDQDFGEVSGSLPEAVAIEDPNIVGHLFSVNNPATPITVVPIDGEYAVATSTYFNQSDGGFPTFFVATNANGNLDADLNLNGRYLAINIEANDGDTIYRVDNIPVVASENYLFRIDLAGLCEMFGVGQCFSGNIPMLTLQIVQGASVLAFEDSVAQGVSNNDEWENIELTFNASTSASVSLVIINRNDQTAFSSTGGNDIGIDNIRFSNLDCDFDRDGIPNILDIDSDNDGILDSVEGNVNSDGLGGRPNFIDIDSDNDGIPDNVEAQPTFGYIPPSGVDSDGDGLDDAYEPSGLTPIVTNGVPDYITNNIDQDCLSDMVEVYDTNGDGISDTVLSGMDADQDGLDDAFDNFIYDATDISRLPPLESFIANSANVSDPLGTISGADIFLNRYDNDGTPTDEPDFREALQTIDGTVNIDICGETLPIDLFDRFDTTTASSPFFMSNLNGGTWTTSTGAPSLTNGQLGTFNPPSSFNAYPITYTYTLLPNLPACTTIRRGVVVISESVAPSVGTTDVVANICADNTTPFTLISRFLSRPLAGGVWIAPDNSTFSTNEDVLFDPAPTSVTASDFGVYTYRVGTGNCTDEATVTVNRVNPNAGSDGTAVQFCITDNTAIVLSSLLMGTPDNTGIWTDASSMNLGVGDTATIIPSNRSAGTEVFTYTVSETIGSLVCSSSSTVSITITNPPTISIDSNSFVCDVTNGTYSVNYITSGVGTITISPSTATIDTTAQLISNIPIDQDVVVSIEDAGGCSDNERFVAPFRPPTIALSTNDTLCVDNGGNTISGSDVEILSGLPAATFNFSWSLDGSVLPLTTSSITVTTPGVYTLSYTEIGNPIQCPREASIEVGTTLSLGDIDIDTGDQFLTDSFTVTINAEGEGLLSYELTEDATGRVLNQMDNVFPDLRAGGYSITVTDNTCGIVESRRFFLIGFNPFLTPNGDGFNDTWNLIVDNTSTQNLELEVTVFDRFGRILQQFDPYRSSGFDGNYRGKPLPANDYWFLVKDKTNGGEFRSHFTLRR